MKKVYAINCNLYNGDTAPINLNNEDFIAIAKKTGVRMEFK